MFQHPALRTNSRSRSFGALTGYNYYVVTLPEKFVISRTLADRLLGVGAKVESDNLPAGTVLLVYVSTPLLSDYEVEWVNGVSIKFEVDGKEPRAGGMGSTATAYAFEKVLEKYATSKETWESDGGDKALARAKELWAASPLSRSAGVSDPYSTSGEEYETVDAGEPATSDAGTTAPSKPASGTTSTTTLKTGYYEGNLEGRAIYYNAERGYIEVVAARPDAGFKTQPKYTRGSEEFKAWEKWAKEQPTTYKGNSRAARSEVISIAKKERGEELPEPGRGGGSSYTPSTASSPSTAPATTPASGTPAPSTGGKKGIPGWVWWTSGTVLVAGLGVWGAIMIKKNKAAAQ